MMKYFINQAMKGKGGGFGRKPYVMVCVPSGITAVEVRAVIDATRQAGARDAYTIEEPFAAAIERIFLFGNQQVVWSLISVAVQQK